MEFEIDKIYRFFYLHKRAIFSYEVIVQVLSDTFEMPEDCMFKGALLAMKGAGILFDEIWLSEEYTSVEEVPLKDLPLYINWEITSAFTRLLSEQ
jgi:hypothetical protein